jgi:dihydroorotase
MRRLDVLSEQLTERATPPTAERTATAAPITFDTILRGGTVIDPANGLDQVERDIAVKDGVIAAVEPVGGALAGTSASEEFDATGLLVTPGLVDLHSHGFQFFDDIGVNFDTACLGRCTTTAVDAGSSGASSFNGFKKFVIDQCKTRVLVLLNISMIGAGAPPLEDPGKGGSSDDMQPVCGPYQSEAFCSVPHTVQCIKNNRDTIVGIKIAMSKSSAALFPGGPVKGEKLFYDAALEAAGLADVPLMCHHTFSTVPLEDCPGNLRAGDIYTHTLHGFESTIVQPAEGNAGPKIHPAVHAAKRNGVVFDIGHGMGSFNWTVAEQCMSEGFNLDVISTDIWNGTCYGPCCEYSECLQLSQSRVDF